MTSTIHRNQQIINRSIIVTIELAQKDIADSALVKKFGDIIVTPSGDFGDPNDSTYPKFNVQAGDPISFFQTGTIKCTFKVDTLDITALHIQAKLLGDAISLSIQNSLVRLRTLTDSSTMDTDITI